MTDTSQSEPKPRWTSVQRVIFGMLAFQLILALVLMGGDLLRALPQMARPSTQPPFDVPVNPGDQTRRYQPSDMPLRQTPGGNPDRRFQSTGDMPVRLNFERDGETLLLSGAIEPGDAERFRTFLQTDGSAYSTVVLNSPGGSVMDALTIGERIRADGANTLMGAEDICLSACPYIFVSGVERRADDGAQLGVHQHFFDVNTVLPAFIAVEDIQRGQGMVMRHLIEMGADPELMQHALVTPPDEIYVFLPDQLIQYAIVTPEDAE